MTRRVLIIGATGTFGSRLAGLLATSPELTLVLGGRTPATLDALRRRLSGAAATIETRIVDRDRPGDLGIPWLVIDAAGPFQDAGYDLALTAVRQGAGYIDLADGRAFVAGFVEALDTPAKAAGVPTITGASSTPALSHAALAQLVEGWTRLDDVLVAISPGARAPRGLSVMQAILSYAGRPVRVFRGGAWAAAPGWSGVRRVDMPGLGRRYVSLCETPDLDLLPARFPIRRDALFMAGLELPVMHLGLAALSLLPRTGLVTSLRPLARPLRVLADLLAPLGTDRGGMIVEASGLDAGGARCHARWALWAEANAGPTTPAAPAAALVRALADGRMSLTGAHPAAGLLARDDILRELVHLPIRTRVDDGLPDDPRLFRRLLGRRFDALPSPLRAIHGATRPTTWRGRAVARVGSGLVARVMQRVLGLPTSGAHDAEVTIAPNSPLASPPPCGEGQGVGVMVRATADHEVRNDPHPQPLPARGRGDQRRHRDPTRSEETWTRRFGGGAFVSRLVDTRRLGVFEERIGLLRFTFDLQPTRAGVDWQLIGWRVGPLPLPRWLAPKVRAAAHERDGRYRFRVVVAHPWVGLLFAYRGWLAP